MKPLLALTFGGALAMLATSAHAVTLTTDPHTYMVSPDHRIRLEFPVGELKVVATDEPHVRFDLKVRCKSGSDEHCEEIANRLILDSDDTGGTLHLKLHKYPQWNNHGMEVMGQLSVPRTMPVEVEMGVGELDITGLEGDLDVTLGVGQADIRALRAKASHVSVDTGIGDAEIQGGGSDTHSRGFIGSHSVWTDGPGRGAVRLHVGVGDATVRLG